jgi:hypothetical protein
MATTFGSFIIRKTVSHTISISRRRILRCGKILGSMPAKRMQRLRTKMHGTMMLEFSTFISPLTSSWIRMHTGKVAKVRLKLKNTTGASRLRVGMGEPHRDFGKGCRSQSMIQKERIRVLLLVVGTHQLERRRDRTRVNRESRRLPHPRLLLEVVVATRRLRGTCRHVQTQRNNTPGAKSCRPKQNLHPLLNLN